MDELKTGAFEISTNYNEFWTDWQLELAKEDLKRRARTAMEKIQREGVPYVSCLYPITRKDHKLALVGFFVLASWTDCEVGEAVYIEDGHNGSVWAVIGRIFDLEAQHTEGPYNIYIYRRIQ